MRAPEPQRSLLPKPGAPPTPLTSAGTASSLSSSKGQRTALPLIQRPVTSGGCRETPSVTSSCTCPLPLPGGLWIRVPSVPAGQQVPVERGPSLGGWLQSCLLSPRTIVGKSRTTGSQYLTSVSSTIAKNSGRQAAAEPGPRRLGRPRPVLREETGTVSEVWGGPGGRHPPHS